MIRKGRCKLRRERIVLNTRQYDLLSGGTITSCDAPRDSGEGLRVRRKRLD